MKRPIETLKSDLEIAQENLAESETAHDREYWRKRCYEISEEIDAHEEPFPTSSDA